MNNIIKEESNNYKKILYNYGAMICLVSFISTNLQKVEQK